MYSNISLIFSGGIMRDWCGHDLAFHSDWTSKS